MTETAPEFQEVVADLDQTRNEANRSRAARLGGRLGRPARALRKIPHIGIYLGLLVTAVGSVLLVVAWGKTAGLTNVALQVPYIISAGFTGLALVVVGITVIKISTEQANASERARQTAELRALLTELRRTIEEDTR